MVLCLQRMQTIKSISIFYLISIKNVSFLAMLPYLMIYFKCVSPLVLAFLKRLQHSVLEKRLKESGNFGGTQISSSIF